MRNRRGHLALSLLLAVFTPWRSAIAEEPTGAASERTAVAEQAPAPGPPPAPPPSPPPPPPPSPPPPPPPPTPEPPPKPSAPTTASPEPTAGAPAWGHHKTGIPISVSVDWGKGLTFKAGDLFSLQIRSRVQVQALVSQPTASAIAAGAKDETQTGFMIRRARLTFIGHVFTPKLTYTIQLGFANRDMESDLLIPLRDAYVTWQPLRDLGLRFGQMKVPYGKQRVVSSGSLQMVDRSVVTGELNLDRDVGLYFLSEDFLGLKGRLQYQIGVFSGRGRNRSFGHDSAMFVGRIQINPFGHFPDQLSEADFVRSNKPRMSIGGGAAYNLNTNRAQSTIGTVLTLGGFSYQHYGADLHFKVAGLSILSEFMYRKGTPGRRDDAAAMPPKTEYPRNALGYFVQAGYLMPTPIEIVARYGEIRPISGGDPSLKLQREAGGGINFYFYEHSLKLQADYFYLFGDDAKAVRHQVRLQTQVHF